MIGKWKAAREKGRGVCNVCYYGMALFSFSMDVVSSINMSKEYYIIDLFYRAKFESMFLPLIVVSIFSKRNIIIDYDIFLRNTVIFQFSQ